TPNQMWVWETDTGRAREFLIDGARALAFAPDGSYLASVGGRESGVCERNPVTGILLGIWPAEPPTATCLAFSPDGGLLAAACTDGAVTLWDTAAGTAIRRLGQPASIPRVTSPASLDQFVAHVAFAGGSDAGHRDEPDADRLGHRDRAGA